MSPRLRPLLLPALGLALATAAIVQSRVASPSPSVPAVESVAPSGGRVVAEGRIAAYPGAEVVVSAEVAGAIVRLPVEELQRVRRGELLVELRSDDLVAAVAEAKAKKVEAEAEVRLAETELARAADLYARHVDTLTRRDRAERDLDVARARVAAVEATLVRLEAELAKRRLTAPIDGVVISRVADPGETVEARAPIVTVADLSRLRVEAEVDEFDAARVRLGAAVEVTAEGHEGRSWRAVVEEIPDAVSGRRLKPQDPGKPSDTRVLIVKVRLDEPTPLKLGQRVEVEIGG
jgi:RND family efflux transporter MFP subunit